MASASNGQPIIVSPYVDAQTGNVIISIVKALTDRNNVLALDLTLAGVQDIIGNAQINGIGYGFILNNDGMVIAHRDSNEKGKYYNVIPDKKELFDKVISTGKGYFDMEVNGKDCTVFVDNVLDQWHLVIVTDYANSVEEKCESLQSFKDKKDWENYRILVHSIKSTSKTIGADEVSAKAKQLEDASKTEDVGYIEENHDSFIKEYKDLSNRILGR